MRILAVQETDWVERNPVLHHRMLESLALGGDEVIVVDYDIQWHQKGRRPVLQRRRVVTDCHKFFDDAHVTVVRPAMLRLPALGRPSWMAANWVELRRIFRRSRPDVVVAYSISNAYLALRLARRHGVPFVYHVLDALHTLAEKAPLVALARPVEQAVLRSADEVIVINRALRDYAVGMGAAPERVRMIPMGVTAGYRDDGDDPFATEALRARLGFGPDDVVMLFMGWLYTFSGLLELLEQLHATRQELPWLKLLVVGDGDVHDELARRRDALGLGDRVVLTGRRPVTEMAGYLRAADVGMLSARPTATMQHIVPAKVVEYMEMGKAVVATRLPGIRAEFGDLPGILYVDGPEGAVDRLREVLGPAECGRRERAAALGRSCAELMRTRPTWDEVTAAFADVVHHASRRTAGAVT